MTFDRVQVFSDIGILLVCLIVGLVAISVLTIVWLRSFRINHPLLGWFAVFLTTGRRERLLMVVMICRFCTGLALLLDDSFLALPLFVYAFLCIVSYLLSRRPVSIGFDLCCSAELVGCYYVLTLLKAEAGRAQTQYGIGLLVVITAIFLLGFFAIQFVVGLLNMLSPKGELEAFQQPTAEEKELERRAWYVLLLPIVFSILPATMFLQVSYVEADVPVYQYVQGKQIRYEAGGKIRAGDTSAILVQGKENIVLNSSALYFEGEEKMLFPAVCSIVRPSLQASNRIPAMSVLEKEGNRYTVRHEKQTVEVEDFFLFDGKDTYYFPAGTTLQWEDESYVTTSLCLVIAKYNQYITVHDLGEGGYHQIPMESGYCTAILADKSIVNLSTDIMYREDGQEQMLFMQPSLLTDLE